MACPQLQNSENLNYLLHLNACWRDDCVHICILEAPMNKLICWVFQSLKFENGFCTEAKIFITESGLSPPTIAVLFADKRGTAPKKSYAQNVGGKIAVSLLSCA